ncbi:MAG: ACT domain-containing protein [Spirochaetales bacterium]|nr:ACT domain-containing protein [Spirochaetales bacterium]MCF7938034.1 ACT domain-containing protein [Spirochaetales bacterium]
MKQLHIFLENKPGRIERITAILAEAEINITAMTIQDTGEYGLFKVLLERPNEAQTILSEKGFACALKDVLAVRVADRPGELNRMVALLNSKGINIKDGHGFPRPNNESVFCAEVDDLAAVERVVSAAGYQLFEG